MSNLTLGSLPSSLRPSVPNDRVFWLTGLVVALGVHLLSLAYFLWTPSHQEAVFQSPAAAPVVVTLASLPATATISSNDSLQRQASQLDMPPPPEPKAKLDVAEKEVKNAEVKVAVSQAKPDVKVKKKPVVKPVKIKHVQPKHQPEKVIDKKPDTVTSQASMHSNSSAQLAHQNQAPKVGAASNQAASEQQTWQSLILAKLQKEKRYPAYALRMKQEDDVFVKFTLDRDGNVVDTEIVKSKGYAALDRESLQVLARSSPLPKPPASEFSHSDTMQLVLPISFSIRNN